jgi:hypothetical protein
MDNLFPARLSPKNKVPDFLFSLLLCIPVSCLEMTLEVGCASGDYASSSHHAPQRDLALNFQFSFLTFCSFTQPSSKESQSKLTHRGLYASLLYTMLWEKVPGQPTIPVGLAETRRHRSKWLTSSSPPPLPSPSILSHSPSSSTKWGCRGWKTTWTMI